jgi:hypothetical protein
MAEYKGTYNPDKKRGELLKDNVSTGEYFKDKKGIFSDTSGLELAKERAEELNNPKKSLFQDFKDKLLGTKEQNEKAKKEMAEQDAKYPDTTQAKVNRMIEKIKPEEKRKGGKVSSYKSGGSVSSASKRADGCAVRGKTKGRMV